MGKNTEALAISREQEAQHLCGWGPGTVVCRSFPRGSNEWPGWSPIGGESGIVAGTLWVFNKCPLTL